LLLPKLLPLGDLDEEEEFLASALDELKLKPLIPPFKRLGLLTRLIEDYAQKTGMPSPPSLSLKLAKNLIRLMDQAVIETISWKKLQDLVPSEFADHWQLTLDFLEIITTHWPQILEEEGFDEPYTRHHHLVDLLISRWEKAPPTHPILAAGSTGTIPATARLLQAIASLPQGAVILPGLDRSLKEEEIQNLSPCHPQYALIGLLQKMKLEPKDVPQWRDLKGDPHPRARLFANVLSSSFASQSPFPEGALEDVYYIPCTTPQEEALTIAILLRHFVETPDQRIVFVTSDLKLVERVREELKRWEIEIDSSSGDFLDQTPPAVFLKLCAHFIAAPQDPIALLSLLKHPLCRMGKSEGELRSEIRQFEKEVLRKGEMSTSDGKAHETSKHFLSLIHYLDSRFPTNNKGKCNNGEGGGREDNQKRTFEEIFKAHQEMAEILSTDEEGVCHLWKGPKGEAVKSFFESLEDASFDRLSFSLAEYSAFLEELFRGQRFRSPSQKHPRLSILGPLEARLFHSDVVILGGLNEGTWPPDVEMDPWLNRPMRHHMGFPSPERRVGLSAHDFGQAFAHSKVYLTRALKVEGAQTVKCRWLERLQVYLKKEGYSLPEEPRVLEWARHLDQPKVPKRPEPPLPKPPVVSRPRRLSVTQIETWMRDPYALYARMILSLAPLDPLQIDVGAVDYGVLIHSALDQFFKVCPDPHHPQALSTLLSIGEKLFEPYKDNPLVQLFWKSRFHQLAHWFIRTEKAIRLPHTQTFTEVRGRFSLSTPKGLFECTAKADRIDILPDGRLRIIDYKTGGLPSGQDIVLGFSPQLPLEGAIALHEGFEGISGTEIESLQFWGLKGGREGGIIKTIPGDPHDLSLKALAGLERMILLFEDETTPYPANPLPMKALVYNDYAHLARLQEWGKI